MNPEVLVGMLAELEGIRELTLDLVERSAPQLLPAPPGARGRGQADPLRAVARCSARGARQSCRGAGVCTTC